MRRRARPILGVDMDNVLSQSDARLRAMIREMFGIRLEEHQMTRYEYMTYGVTEEQLIQVFRIFNVEACRTLRVVPGAKAALVRLARRYEIALVTSRNPESKASTEYWLHAKGLPYDQLHFKDDKHTLGIPYHAFIEDRHEHAHRLAETGTDRKSTRLNSSHGYISYAVFCLKKKKKKKINKVVHQQLHE